MRAMEPVLPMLREWAHVSGGALAKLLVRVQADAKQRVESLGD